MPRTIRASSWTQLKDIEGCDPLTVPLSKLLYQGSENYWLRKLATGREVYVATMGEVSQVVFVSEILSQLRSRGIDLDKLARHKALQDGQALEKKKPSKALQNLLEINYNDGILLSKQIPVPNTRLLNWKPRLLHLRLLPINLLHRILKYQPQKVKALKLEYSHLLKLHSKDKDLLPLILPNCWSALAVTINGWKATWSTRSVMQNTKLGSAT